MNDDASRLNRRYQCPNCRRLGAWLLEESAPFCSARCRLIDLGKWLNEEHSVQMPSNHIPRDELDELGEG
jgi:uncharacterized protein